MGRKISVSFDTVDGRNPAPVDRWFIPLLKGFQPSKVLQDFFHPQYGDPQKKDRAVICRGAGRLSGPEVVIWCVTDVTTGFMLDIYIYYIYIYVAGQCVNKPISQ